MIREELYGGVEDGRVIDLPDYLPTEMHMPYVTDLFIPTFRQAIYRLDTKELKYKYIGEVSD